MIEWIRRLFRRVEERIPSLEERYNDAIVIAEAAKHAFEVFAEDLDNAANAHASVGRDAETQAQIYQDLAHNAYTESVKSAHVATKLRGLIGP